MKFEEKPKKTTEITVPKLPEKSADDHGKGGSEPTRDLFAMVLVSLLVGFLGGWLALTLFNNNGLIKSDTSQTNQITFSENGQAITEIAKEVSPSVVSITVETKTTNPYFSRDFTQSGAGTGLILTEDGLILTNRHVVPDNVSSVVVVLSDGTTYKDVEVVDRDLFNDLAFLQIKDVSGLKAAMLGDSSQVEIGNSVVAIGNALGQFTNTVTSGIISGLGRPIIAGDSGSFYESLNNLFQTDAAINPGNSGGPLVNIKGEVIGINTAVAGDAQNIGFAIPIDDAKPLIASVKEEGRIIRPYLGVRYVSLTNDIAIALDLSVDRGAYLYTQDGTAIIPGSPADKAGLKDEDIILEVGGKKVDQRNSLSTVLSQYNVSDEVELKVLRSDKEMTVKVTLEEAPNELP